MAKDCSGGERSSGGAGCYTCGESGHFARDCVRKLSGNVGSGGERGGAGGGGCYNCGDTGHFARDCVQKQPRALQASNAILQGNLSLTPSKLFVGGLSPTTDVDLLKDVFGRFGKIVDAVVISDRESGVSKGFGFITYDSIDAANTAMQYMNEQELDGRIIGVNPADSGGGGGGFARRGGYGGGRGGFNRGGFGHGGFGHGGFGRGGFGRGGYDFVR